MALEENMKLKTLKEAAEVFKIDSETVQNT